VTLKTFLLGLAAAAAIFSAVVVGVPSTSDKPEESGRITVRLD